MKESSKKYERHIFVCVNEKMMGKECCGRKDASDILVALRKHVNDNQLFHRFNISKAKCLGHCLEGPTIAVYPDGKILTEVSSQDVKEIIKKFLT